MRISSVSSTASNENKAHIQTYKIITNETTPWLWSASELYRPSERRLSAKLVPTFADRGVSRNHLGGSPTAVISVYRPEPLLNWTHKAEWTPLQIHYFSENVVAQKIEPGPLDQ
jgi:hypothetical protein